MAFLCELPDSVVSKILIRLPVKDLMQCRCVDKSWYKLVSDPYFIWSHLSQSADEKGYVITAHRSNSYMEEYYSIWCDITFLEKLKVKCTISESFRSFRPLGCAKGLLLMLNSKTFDLYLWNPGLQRIKPLASAHATYRKKFGPTAYGFAFLSDICDYKVIRILDYSCDDVCRVAELYSLKTDSWRRIETPFMCVIPDYNGPLLAAYVNPFFYWIVTALQDNGWAECLLLFDIKSETFKMTSFPVACLSNGRLLGSLAVFEESLYLFAFDIGGGWGLWMMKENCSCGVCWLKICTFECEGRVPVGFMKNGDVIMEASKYEVSLCKVDHDPRNVGSPRKSDCEIVWEPRCSEVYNYFPSLALLNLR